jgi:hypothetical protein
MKEIHGDAKTVRELLKGVKYSIDYYQREYMWQEKQIRDLVQDLSEKFQEDYRPDHERKRVKEYGHYFLGSIIVSEKSGSNFLVDGQQRLTSLSLLLVLLRNLQKGHPVQVNIDELIYSEEFGEKSFNLAVDERIPAMEALFEGESIDVSDRNESVQNLVARYQDLDNNFPEELRGDALPFFIDWLLQNVHLIKITAYNDEDAYTIFETMNDRGLSLSNTEMLKGYLLSNMDDNRRTEGTRIWNQRIRELADQGKDVESDCIKAWLRSQYAKRIRERRKGSQPEDFERIGTEFHRWLRDSVDSVCLDSPGSYYRFVDRYFGFFTRQYLRVLEASKAPVPGLEHVLYNAQLGFGMQNMVLLAPLRPDDSDDVAVRKIDLVARYIDILLAWRVWNSRSIAYSTLQYAMFVAMREIRGLDLAALSRQLHALLATEGETFGRSEFPRVHQQNRYQVHRMLARLTDFVETSSGAPSRYLEYVGEGPGRYEVEHILADHWERHGGEFATASEFAEHRNRIGGLLLLPKKFNASFGDLEYASKLGHYNSQNLLARSLNAQCYDHNPGFLQFREASGLPFQPFEAFTKTELEARCQLYRLIAQRIWDPDDLLRGIA